MMLSSIFEKYVLTSKYDECKIKKRKNKDKQNLERLMRKTSKRKF